jgi:phosphosulfolactate synthase (CoM biosynthesis protein A)
MPERHFSSITNRNVDQIDNITKLPTFNGLYQYLSTSQFETETFLAQLTYLGFRQVKITNGINRDSLRKNSRQVSLDR